MSRIVLPSKPDPRPPQLESSTPSTIAMYLLSLLWFLFGSSVRSFLNTVRDILNWANTTLVPKTLAQQQRSYIQREHMGRLRKKWEKLSQLPTFAVQDETINLLQEVNHDSSKEVAGFLEPDKAPVKTVVKLLLDQRNRPHVQFLLENQPVTSLVDTGASLSVLSYSQFKALKNHESFMRSYDTPKLYDHQQNLIPIKFSVTLRATFDDKTILLSLLVSPSSKTNILGMDCLIGRSIILSHRGTDAYLIIGECTADKRPVMKLPNKMALYIMNDVVVPAESVKTVTVTPCVYPTHVEIPDSELQINYITHSEGLEGKTKMVKLDESGRAKLKICNRSLVDMPLFANTVIGTGSFLGEKEGSPAKKLKPTKAKSEVRVKEKPTPDPPKKPASVQQVSAESTLELEKPTQATSPEKMEGPKITEVNCFCSIPESVLIIKSNRMGDTICPFISAGSYIRGPLISGVSERFNLGKKKIIVIFSSTKKDFITALENTPKGNEVAYIANKDESQDTLGRKQIKLLGKCTEHPFLYSARPDFISFCKTIKGKHLQMIHDLQERIVFDVLNVKIEMYHDPRNPKQIHYVLHIPDVFVLKEQYIENVVASLVRPFFDSVRILEPYLFPDGNSLRSTIFNGTLSKVAKLNGITLQGRLPSLEKTYPAYDLNIKNCTCDYCVKCRDKLTYGNMNGTFDKEVQENQDFLL